MATMRWKPGAKAYEVQGGDSTATTNVVGSQDDDRTLATKFGYKPVLKREFGYLSTFSFAFSVSGLFSTIAATFSYPLAAGGSASAVWSWLISGVGCMCLAVSLLLDKQLPEPIEAGLCKALRRRTGIGISNLWWPVRGNLPIFCPLFADNAPRYYTVSRLAPKRHAAIISWLTGWLNLLGQVAAVASSEWSAAALLLAVVSLATDFNYAPTVGQTVGTMAALTCITGIVNSLSTRWIEMLTKTYVIFHLAVLLTCAIALLAVAPPEEKHTANYVFTDSTSESGWSPPGWSFMFGFLSVGWIMTDYDATAHITEEVKDPQLKAPWAISMAMLFTYIAGFLFNIVLCFVMGDPAELLESPIEQPVAQIFYNVLGKAGGIVFTLCAFVILKFVTFTAMQSLARTVFSFARDRLVPFPHLWTQIAPTTGTPVYAVWISVFWCIVINLIGLGSYTAILGVFNITAIALDWSYCVPIICKLMFPQFIPGPWHLGKFSKYINFYAVIWTAFVSIIFICPTEIPVTAETVRHPFPIELRPDKIANICNSQMNYAIVYIVGILFFAIIFWYGGARKWYTGPVAEAETYEGSMQSGRGSDDAVQQTEIRAHEKV